VYVYVYVDTNTRKAGMDEHKQHTTYRLLPSAMCGT
jgi:hypothetical protein